MVHKILFLAANPRGADEGALASEARTIQDELSRGLQRDGFALTTRMAVHSLDILRELRQLRPSIVHFSGPGSSEGLHFLSAADQPVLVSGGVLSATFASTGEHVQVAVMSGRDTRRIANALSEVVPICVGFPPETDDSATRTFCIGFYGALADARSAIESFRNGITAMRLEGASEAALPTLFSRPDTNTARIFLTQDDVTEPASQELIDVGPPDKVSIADAPQWIADLRRSVHLLGRRDPEAFDAINDQFGDPVDLTAQYISPEIQHLNPADSDEDIPIPITRPIWPALDRFFNSRPLTQRDGSNQLFVLADAGMGKTSLLVMMMLTYLDGRWPPERRVVLLKLGRDTLEKVDALKNKRNTLLLLDALDEDPETWDGVGDRLAALLKATTKFWRVIITCRTQFFPSGDKDQFERPGHLVVQSYVCQMFYLALFDDTQVEEALSLRFPSLGDRRRATASRIIRRMQSLRFRPMLLAHIEDLLESNVADPDELFVYDALVEEWLRRESQKMIEMKIVRSDVRDSLRTACIKIALKLSRLGVPRLSPEDLSRLVNEHPEVPHVRAIEVGGRSLLNRTSHGVFRFPHYSIQEFLVVKALLQEGPSINEDRRLRLSQLGTTFILRHIARVPPEQRARLLTMGLPLAERDLGNADLEAVNFEGADLRQCNMFGTNLAQARLWGANLAGAVGHSASFRHAGLVGAHCSNTIFGKCDFSGASLEGADLRGVDATGSTFEGANLRGASLEDAVLVSANLKGARFDTAQLVDTDLNAADLSGASFVGAALRDVELSGATLRDVSFEDSDFAPSNLGGATFARVNARRARFAGARLGGANLAEFDLSGADLRGAMLTHEAAAGSNFKKTTMTRQQYELARDAGADVRFAIVKPLD